MPNNPFQMTFTRSVECDLAFIQVSTESTTAFSAGSSRTAHAQSESPISRYTLEVEPSQRRSALSPSPIAHLAVIIDHIPMTSHEHPSGTAKEWRASRRPPHPTVAAYDSLRVGRVGLGDVWFQLEICPQGTQRSRWSRLYSCSFGRTRHGEAVAVMEDGADDGRLRVRACVRAGVRACVRAWRRVGCMRACR